ncbi:PREDICTED: torsin-like protein [Cyphomyrmex costatus]|uniref:Torsin-like protein n=1 Tax=Cyphomyrmex costatus TaxID=456900 RepID=A0A195CI19_9HYME|nr:PREDICTED: torsin-like protein [Cyphomyrmex costatus]KYN00385.1 Torsin-like protein [Cyphomyrmex costatus]
MNLVERVLLPSLIFTFLLFARCAHCALITLSIAGAVSSLGYYAYEKYKCQYQECCTDEYIPADLDGLEYIFAANLYGQQIAHVTIINAFRCHLENQNPSKALVMSFHGTPGTGKNYVAQMIAKTFYKKGVESNYFYFFNGRNDFPLQQKVDEYKDDLYKIILNALQKCERSMFVFDEVDKMPEDLLNVLVPFLDYKDYHKSIKSGFTYQNKAVFIFLSNTGSTQIVQHLTNVWMAGKGREDTKLQDFEKLIVEGAFREKGGFHYSDTIQTSVIDHYVPFLPLEEIHVRKCLKKVFKDRDITPTEEMVEEVLSHVTFGPEPYNLYSMAGCKRIEQKVATIVYRKQTESKLDLSES